MEDACQAHGATFRGRRAGSFGTGAFSLYGTKNMTTGEGGFITTNDDRLADFIRLYRSQGMRQRYHHEILGYNFRMTDIGAAIGLVQFGKLTRNTARRRRSRPATTRRSPTCPSGRRSRPRAASTCSTSTRSTWARSATRSSRTSARPGSAPAIYYPIPVHRQAYVLERGLHADLPVTDAAAARARSRCRCTRA